MVFALRFYASCLFILTWVLWVDGSSGGTAWSCLSQDYTARVYLNTLPVPPCHCAYIILYPVPFSSLKHCPDLAARSYRVPNVGDNVVLLLLCLSGLAFTWRGESGAVLRLEHYCLPPSGLHSLRLLILVLISSSFTTMLCWGNARDGQLGIGLERNPVFEPRSCHVFSGRGLKEIACGGQHTLFLLQDGSVYTCGSNSCGQLGHDKAESCPGKLWARTTDSEISG